MSNLEISALLTEYEQTVSERNSYSSLEKRSYVRKANRLTERILALGARLSETAEGQQGLESLLHHENRAVRLSAATACLVWDLPEAIEMFEALASPEIDSLSAKVTLYEYRAGRLGQLGSNRVFQPEVMMTGADVVALLAEYEQVVLERDFYLDQDSCSNLAFYSIFEEKSNKKKVNRLSDKIRSLASHLRGTAAGQQGLESLLHHENRAVRLSAATACLVWDSSDAVEALEALASPEIDRNSAEAKSTLRTYRTRLKHDQQ